jgi:hypothetical protein
VELNEATPERTVLRFVGKFAYSLVRHAQTMIGGSSRGGPFAVSILVVPEARLLKRSVGSGLAAAHTLPNPFRFA